MRVYHFVGATERDGRPVPPDGVWVQHESLRDRAYYMSRQPFGALHEASGCTLCLMEVVARRRRIVKRIDAEPLLREFARWCALQALPLWEAPDVVRRYLESGDDTLREAAQAAAERAAGPAARASAWDSAAWAVATSSASWLAARAAAAAASHDALDAAYEAAGVAARAAQIAAGDDPQQAGSVRLSTRSGYYAAHYAKLQEMVDAAFG
jgi:hypothetical protein